MTMRSVLGLFALLVALMSLTGCGQKGPLYFPDSDESEEEQESSLTRDVGIG